MNVPDNFKKDVWTALMGEFEFNLDPNCCCAIIETGFPPLWRRYKSDLRNLIKGKRQRKTTKRSAVPEEESEVQEEESEVPERIELTPELWEAAKEKVPPGMNPNIWIDFVENEKKAEKITKNAANAECRKKSAIRHILEQCSYNNKKYKLDESGIKAVSEDTTDKWLLGNQRSDGTVHLSAVKAHRNWKRCLE